jgi:putative N-acetyltransferase (TIGR04045 family)
MIFEPVERFLAAQFQIKSASQPWEQRAAARLRRQVFCTEQGIFDGDDRDAIDDVAIPLVALSLVGVAAGDVVGTVRIHRGAAEGEWWGSRLAVSREYRRVGALGATLIRLAVSSAHAQGCTHFFAHVQSQNEELFRKLHWRTVARLDLHGREHVRMQADLSQYPPFSAVETGLCALAREAVRARAPSGPVSAGAAA